MKIHKANSYKEKCRITCQTRMVGAFPPPKDISTKNISPKFFFAKSHKTTQSKLFIKIFGEILRGRGKTYSRKSSPRTAWQWRSQEAQGANTLACFVRIFFCAFLKFLNKKHLSNYQNKDVQT